MSCRLVDSERGKNQYDINIKGSKELPARFTIQALTDTALLTITRDDYNRIGKSIPLWYQFEKRFIALYFTMLEDRIFRHLSMTLEEPIFFLKPNFIFL